MMLNNVDDNYYADGVCSYQSYKSYMFACYIRACFIFKRGTSTSVGSTVKMHKQKGTGKARRGSAKSHILRGGARAFSSFNRRRSRRINKKEYNSLINGVFCDKYKQKRASICIGSEKDILSHVQNILNDKRISLLVLHRSVDELYMRKIRNIYYVICMKYGDSRSIDYMLRCDRIVSFGSHSNNIPENFVEL